MRGYSIACHAINVAGIIATIQNTHKKELQ
jgi:hypothetical protein